MPVRNRLYLALEMCVRLFYQAEVMSLLLWHPECLWPRSHREQNVIYIGSIINTNVTHISGVVTSLSAYTHIAGRYFCLPLWECRSLQIIYKLLTFSVHSTRFSVGPANNSSGSTADWGTASKDVSFRVRLPVGIHSYCPHSVLPGSTQPVTVKRSKEFPRAEVRPARKIENGAVPVVPSVEVRREAKF
jgi:hypothetical protein